MTRALPSVPSPSGLGVTWSQRWSVLRERGIGVKWAVRLSVLLKSIWMLWSQEIKRTHSMGMQLCKPERRWRSVRKGEEGERPSGSRGRHRSRAGTLPGTCARRRGSYNRCLASIGVWLRWIYWLGWNNRNEVREEFPERSWFSDLMYLLIQRDLLWNHFERSSFRRLILSVLVMLLACLSERFTLFSYVS